MIFNSLDFAVFLPIVFALYWLVTALRARNLIVVIASYVFYGWWDWRFLSLILFSTVVDYAIGRMLSTESAPTKRKVLLWVSIGVNLGLLGFFKYYNFFLENFVSAFSLFGQELNPRTLNIILPVGISFYTFQTLSYTIDVYRKQLEPTRDFVAFAAFVSFFPQLVAGPIERASNLLPQFYKVRDFNYSKAVDGLRQILWGLIKKMVIADNAAEVVNTIFDGSGDYSGSTLVLGAVFFAFQIYGDFSGYSDIAIGTARLFGFDLKQNFAFPYFSRDIAEFWRRWHISLSTWFRDYVYIPLGGSRGGNGMRIRNTFIIFIVSGFWHGANWTFVVWGALNAIYFLPLLLTNRNRSNMAVVAGSKFWPSVREALSVLGTFGATVLAWIFFRADNVGHAVEYIGGIFSTSLFSVPELLPLGTCALIVGFTITEWIGREHQYAIEKLGLTWHRNTRWLLYLGLVFLLIAAGGKQQDFIYFQF